MDAVAADEEQERVEEISEIEEARSRIILTKSPRLTELSGM